VFHYGLVFDPCERSCADFQAELDLIVSNPRITLPAFISIAIPILGTPLFRRRLAEGAFLPGVLLRDMEGISLLCRPREPLAIVAPYVRKVQTRPLPTGRLLAHAARFAWRYRGTLGRWAMASALLNTVSMGLPALGSNRRERRIPLRQRRSSFVSGTEAPGSLYRPAIAVPAALRGHFVPQPITDSAGALHPDLWDDLGQEQVGTGTVVA
jgi:hopanoid C-2 methylase